MSNFMPLNYYKSGSQNLIFVMHSDDIPVSSANNTEQKINTLSIFVKLLTDLSFLWNEYVCVLHQVLQDHCI
jgi:hypothetical protein